MRTTLTDLDRGSFAAPLKYSFLSVMNDEGYPHMNLITSLEGNGDDMMFADNYAGRTKDLIRVKKQAGFLVLGLDMNLWIGKLRLRQVESEGPNLEYYNDKPSSRYNSYFTFHNAFLCDLLGIEGPAPYDVAGVLPLVGAVLPHLEALSTGEADGPVSGVAAEIIGRDKMGKFLSWQGEDGIPELIPLFGAIPAGTGRMVFSMAASEKLASIPAGAKATLHCLQLTTMHGVQLRGVFQPADGGIGILEVKQVYNPMPPRAAIVYPRTAYAAVTEF